MIRHRHRSIRPFMLAMVLVFVPSGCRPHQVGLTDSGTGSVTRRDSLQLSARTIISGGQAVVQVFAFNASSHVVPIKWGDCAVDLELRVSASGQGKPAFSWYKRKATSAAGEEVCGLVLGDSWLQPGQKFSPPEYTLTIPVRRLGADTLARGTYYLTARVRMSANDVVGIAVPAGSLEVR
ncbi:MAG: hypothetical protein ABJE47_25180 [bacterium]